MEQFGAGERVAHSAIFRVYHDSHRLMHEVTLRAGDVFPRCKQCGAQVRFELLRAVKDLSVVPFRTGAILEEYPETIKARKQAG